MRPALKQAHELQQKWEAEGMAADAAANDHVGHPRATVATSPPQKIPHADGAIQSAAVRSLLGRVLSLDVVSRFDIRISPDGQAASDWCKHVAQRAAGEGSANEAPECFRLSVDIVGAPSVLVVEASTGVAAATAIHYVLRKYLNASVAWGIERTGMQVDNAVEALRAKSFVWPTELNAEPEQYASVQYRYYYNVCTFGYTTAFWSWPEWEREIDWMALHGINLPLGFIGQEHVWMELWTKHFHLTQDEVLLHFTGPAFWPWHWMGNLQRWAGPVDLEYIEQRRILQHRILARARSLGIDPVLPAFAGHIPKALAKKYSNMSVRYSDLWMAFNEVNSGLGLLDPTDPMFPEIAQKFMEIQTEEYGYATFYNADTFNEMFPQSDHGDYLAAAARAVIQGIRSVNPWGKWILQGWLFLHHSMFWGRHAVESYLSGAQGNVMVLDLASDIAELWSRHKSFYGNQFVWCALHNFGGRRGVYGNIDRVRYRIHKALATAGRNMAGLGLSMEAIHHNPAAFDAITDLFFVAHPTILNQPFDRAQVSRGTVAWVERYVRSRYGNIFPDSLRLPPSSSPSDSMTQLLEAWKGLLSPVDGAYGHRVTCCPAWSYIGLKPDLSLSHQLDFHYSAASFFRSYLSMYEAATAKQNAAERSALPPGTVAFANPLSSPTLRYDMIDFLRQVLENIFTDCMFLLVNIVQHGVHHKPPVVLEPLKRVSDILIDLIEDIDAVLSLDDNFNFRRNWLEMAARWGGRERDDPLEGPQMNVSAVLFNAKNLLTLWGDGRQGYPNYAARAMSGLYSQLYKKRWSLFLGALHHRMHTEVPLTRNEVFGMAQKELRDLDWAFCVNDSAPADYAPEPSDVTPDRIAATFARIEERYFPGEQAEGGERPDPADAPAALEETPLWRFLWSKDVRIARGMCRRFRGVKLLEQVCTEQVGDESGIPLEFSVWGLRRMRERPDID